MIHAFGKSASAGHALAPSRLVAVLGPTNTGKTHLAVERMLGHASGMIGLPLRLLAREVYDRIVKRIGPRSVALITGEEKIIPPRAVYFVCTVEAMPLSRRVEFLAVDEIQLCADPGRGHVFTNRLLHARGTCETMFMGSAAMGPLVRRLLPGVEIVSRERFSVLGYAGQKKLTRLPRRSVIVAFSAEQVYAIAELIRRQRGGAAVVMGSLSPRTRNAQVALYQSGEVDFLVATDAIGMGLNMDVDHVAFAGLRKFDGKKTRWLTRAEAAQIAGRAGRFQRDGTFGVTGDCEAMDEDLVQSIETHSVEPVLSAEWRSGKLDFGSLATLIRSLSAPPTVPGLKLAEEALDETVLKRLAQEPEIAAATRNRSHLHRLWDVAQTPDFRKTTLDDHLRLVREVFEYLTGKTASQDGGRLPDDWIAAQLEALDRTTGEIDMLSQRLAGVRTLAYVANRPDWLRNPGEWQARTRALEDRLSDTLHEKLMQRFIDRRTSVLMRSLNVNTEVLAGVAPDGAVTVEGQAVGHLTGVAFEPAKGSSALEDKALRSAAQRAVAPELVRRLGQLAADGDGAFSLEPDGTLYWRGAVAGKLAGGRAFAPKVRLVGELGHLAVRERAQRRLEAFVVTCAGQYLFAIKALQDAVADGGVRGLARGVAWRLLEAGGVIDRALVAVEVGALSQQERRTLRALGVRIGAFSLYLPSLAMPDAQTLTRAFAAAEAPHWRPLTARPAPMPTPVPAPHLLAAFGLRAVAGLSVPLDLLERLDETLRAAPRDAGGAVLTAQALEALGLDPATGAAILKGLGFTTARKPRPGEPVVWRRRKDRALPSPTPTEPPRPDNPFAALSVLNATPEHRKRPRPPRRKARTRAASA